MKAALAKRFLPCLYISFSQIADHDLLAHQIDLCLHNRRLFFQDPFHGRRTGSTVHARDLKCFFFDFLDPLDRKTGLFQCRSKRICLQVLVRIDDRLLIYQIHLYIQDMLLPF